MGWRWLLGHKRFNLQTRDTLSSELILLNLQSQLARFLASYPATGNQIEQAFLVQLRRPTDCHFETSSNRQIVISGKQHPGTADVQGLANTLNDL